MIEAAATYADTRTVRLTATPQQIGRKSNRRAIAITQLATASDVWIDFGPQCAPGLCQILIGIKGASIVLRYQGEVWACIAAGGEAIVSVTEVSQ